MRKLLLITLSALIIASGFFVLTGNEAFAAFTENKKCYNASDGTRSEIDQDTWQRYVKVSVPIPGVTKELVCLGTQEPNVDIEVDRYYYATDLGSYLAGFYEFFVSIVGIMAAVMILYAGIQWVLAAGNQSRIQSAKNIIFSAVIGIVIAFTSYLLLFLLNPALINYDSLNASLKSVSGIDQSDSLLCDNYVDEWAEVDPSSVACTVNPEMCQYHNFTVPYTGPPYEGIIIGSAAKTACGATAKVLSDGSSCLGTYCGEVGGVCIAGDYTCLPGYIGGIIDYTGNAYIDSITFNAVCEDGTLVVVPENSFGAPMRNTMYTILDEQSSYYSLLDNAHASISYFYDDCSRKEGLAGFILNIEVNDDQGAAFNLSSTTDDHFAVGRKCQAVSKYKDPEDITVREWDRTIAEGRLITLSDLYNGPDITVDNLRKNPFRCDFNINRINFPAR